MEDRVQQSNFSVKGKVYLIGKIDKRLILRIRETLNHRLVKLYYKSRSRKLFEPRLDNSGQLMNNQQSYRYFTDEIIVSSLKKRARTATL